MSRNLCQGLVLTDKIFEKKNYYLAISSLLAVRITEIRKMKELHMDIQTRDYVFAHKVSSFKLFKQFH